MNNRLLMQTPAVVLHFASDTTPHIPIANGESICDRHYRTHKFISIHRCVLEIQNLCNLPIDYSLSFWLITIISNSFRSNGTGT